MKKYIIISIITTIVIYIVVSFVKWNILWGLNIPEYESRIRFAMFMVFIMKAMIDIVLCQITYRDLKQQI